MKTQSAKAKGRKLQQWTRDQILDVYNHLEEDDVRSTSMGASGSDVQLSPLECNNRGNTQPLVIVKENRRKPLAVVDAEHFFELLGKLNHD